MEGSVFKDTTLFSYHTKFKTMEEQRYYQLYYKGKPLFMQLGYSVYHAIDQAYSFLIGNGHKVDRKDLTAKKFR